MSSKTTTTSLGLLRVQITHSAAQWALWVPHSRTGTTNSRTGRRANQHQRLGTRGTNLGTPMMSRRLPLLALSSAHYPPTPSPATTRTTLAAWNLVCRTRTRLLHPTTRDTLSRMYPRYLHSQFICHRHTLCLSPDRLLCLASRPRCPILRRHSTHQPTISLFDPRSLPARRIMLMDEPSCNNLACCGNPHRPPRRTQPALAGACGRSLGHRELAKISSRWRTAQALTTTTRNTNAIAPRGFSNLLGTSTTSHRPKMTSTSCLTRTRTTQVTSLQSRLTHVYTTRSRLGHSLSRRTF